MALGVTPIALARLTGDEPHPSVSDAARVTAAESPASASATATATPSAERRRPAVPAQEVHGAEELVRKVESVTDDRAKRTARKAERTARKATATPEPEPAPFEVRIGSFNVLGSQHTAPGGDRRRFPPASTRSVGAANLMAKHGVDIVGTQELQDDQLRAIQSRTGMEAYPGLGWGVAETDNSILYDGDRFEFVEGSRFTIPFMGRPRPQPILKLRERATGREFYVVNTHLSAGGGRYLTERRSGMGTLVNLMGELKATGLPVLLTGDMNDREEFYCRVVSPAGMVAPNGGSYASGCQPPPSPLPVDWVVGSGVSWSGYWRDTTPVTNRISDHFFISATARVS